MAFRIDGVGMTDLGTSNLRTHEGFCKWCGRAVSLRAFETRTWFTFFYVPLFPLGRKHVINYCPVCKAHKVMSESQYRKMADKKLTAAKARLAADPCDASSAANLLKLLWEFDRDDEACVLAAQMGETFADDVDIQCMVGRVMMEVGCEGFWGVVPG